MTDRLSPKLLDMILKHPKTKGMKEPSVRVAISRIHRQNPGVTLNASAHLFAEKRKFSLFGSLTTADRESLQDAVTITSAPPRGTQASSKKGAKRHDIQPDFDSPFIKEANDNAEPYVHVYLLENGLRQVILDKFKSSGNWWTDEKTTPKEVQDYARRIQEAEKKYPWLNPRGTHPIYYVGLQELFRIIENTWKPNFREVFPHLEDLRTWVRESIPIRNIVAHNVKTRLQDRQNIKIRTDYICRLIEKWSRKRTV